jgi:tRNA (guanine37-N1)-methyltransferase
MRIDVITLFPQMFQGPLTESILGRSVRIAPAFAKASAGKQDEKLLDIHLHDLRSFGIGKYHQIDDSPYGGGAGMVMRADVLVKAIEEVTAETKTKPHRIYFTPRGKVLKQTSVEKMAAKHERLILLCGHYEGIDQRVIDGGWIDEEVSIGDYVLTGGELPAMVLIDAVARHIPGVLGHEESAHQESFSKSLDRKKEYPHYTKPAEFRGLSVPDVLTSGHHKEIQKWRKENLR